jgi:hypothetical protein
VCESSSPASRFHRCSKTKVDRLHPFLGAFAALVVACLAQAASAGTNVAINVNTQTSTPIAAGFSGYNAPQLRNGVEYYDPKFVAAVAPLNPGWLRFPAGTASMAYDWNPADSTGGHIDIPWMNLLIDGDPAPVTGQPADILTISQPLTQAKGGVYLSDFATFANTFGARAIVCFNGYTDTDPGTATLMAQAAQSAGLNVVEWELANEAYLYPLIFPSPSAYAMAMYNPYFTGIAAATPNATVGLFLAGQFTGSTGNSLPPNWLPDWDTGMAAYTPQYWNAVSMHVYPLTKMQSSHNTVQILNGILAHGTGEYISSYVDPLAGANTPIFITEFNCCAPDNDKFLSFLYNGVFLTEYIVRMSAVPNVKGVGVNSLYTDNSDYHGLIQSFDDYESYLLGQVAADPSFSTDTATNPLTQFQFYTSAPGLALEVANQAINNSTGIWPTTVTGGPYVPIQGYDGEDIPAIYAQGYQGNNGSHYVVITNKSSKICTTTIQVNGVHVSGAMNITTLSNANAFVSNTAAAPNTVQIQTTSASNPISIGPYSVTVAQW